MTQLEIAKKGIITRQMQYVSKQEGLNAKILRKLITQGEVVIPVNKNHKNLKPVAIGKDLTVKVNANIGASPVALDAKIELKKFKVAQSAGADTIMDLTIARKANDINKVRQTIFKNCSLPLGTVPIYQAVIEAGGLENLTIKDYLKVYEEQAREGVDFTTVHAGVTKAALNLVKKRLMPVVSRGGSFMLRWMARNNKESFLYEYFDEILEIAREFDVTISLGDGLRPGSIADATDKAQIYELRVLGELALRARDKGVQVMIEGPGHIPLNEIEENVKLEKKICEGAPFYVLGPLPIDTAVGYDHIACSIGGALAAYYGADFLCYVTPQEHIGLPDIEDVREGVVITKIAASVADLARGNKKAILKSKLISEARKDFDWRRMSEYALDGKKFKELIKKEPRLRKGGCSMCGDDFCALKVFNL
ncbi:MAG: phosphomethylpyrimidine synthase ThiC [Candidatus Omnitrophica bacterium]|nr:phosphomethylpyrimidine synthase ThiC [Candidatus Omnitrophota bacterium]